MRHLAAVLLVCGPAAALFAAEAQEAGKMDPKLRKALAAEVHARFRRDSVGEVLDELYRAAGLVSASISDERGLPPFSFEKERASAREVLGKLAEETGLALEFRDGTAVLWRRMDRARLAALLRTVRGEDFLERDPDRQLRCEAVWELATSGAPEAIAAVWPCLLDEDRAIARWARVCLFTQWPSPARAPLYRFAPPPAEILKALQERYGKATAEHEKNDQRMLLCQLGDRGLIPAVEKGLRELAQADEPEEPWVWCDCVQHMPAPAFLPILMEWRRHRNEKAEVRVSAVWGLRFYEGPEVTKAFGDMLGDADPRIRNSAVHCLRQRRDGTEMADALARWTQEAGHYGHKISASEALGLAARRSDRAFDLLARSEEHLAVYGLARARRPESFDLIRARLATAPARGEGRGHVFRALGQLRDPRCLDALVEGLKDEEERACRGAVVGLGALGDKRAEPALRRMLEDTRPGVWMRAGQSLVELRAEDAPEVLARMFASENHEVAQAAVQSIGFHMAARSGFELVSAQMRKAAPARRAALYEAIGWSWEQPPYSIPMVLADLAHEDPAIRTAAAKFARRLCDPRLVGPLLALLGDADAKARFEAAETLRERFGHEPGVAEALQKQAAEEEAF